MDEQKKKNIIQSTENPSGMIHHNSHAILQDIGNRTDFAPPAQRPPPPPPPVDENNDNPSFYIENSFDSNNQVSFENKIIWKGEEYTLPPLQKVPSIEQALIHLKTKTHYDEHLDKATNEEEKTMITNVYNILEQFVIENFTAAQSSIHVSNIIQRDKGVYIAYLDNVSLPKFGFTQNYGTRFKFLDNVHFAAKIDMKLNDIDERIQNILNQDCPMLQYHPDRFLELRETIYFHLQELIVACSFETCTRTIGELFLSLPSARVREILTLPEEIKMNLHQITSKLPSCCCLDELYTWPTLSSHLESLAKMNPNGFLASKIGPSKPFGFVTNYLNASCLLPSIQHTFQNVVDCCPRAKQVSILVEQLIDSNNNDIVQTVKSWRSTYGESSYVPASDEQLAKGAIEKIRQYISSLRSPLSVLKIERCTFEAILKYDSAFAEEVFDLKSKTDILSDNKFAICFLRKTNLPVIITSSFFVMVTEETGSLSRIEAVRSYFIYLQFLKKIGFSSEDTVMKKVAQLKTFLMILVDFDGSYSFARQKIFPQGYFLSWTPKSVSKCISLGQLETLVLYHELGEDMFNKVLTAFGVQVPSPFSDHYSCRGIAGFFDCESRENEYGFISCIGVTKPWHPFRGIFVCHNCHRKVERAELCYYEDNYNAISDDQKNRMHELIKRKEYHNRYVNSNSIHDISKTRKRRNVEFQKSDEERRAILDKKARWAEERGDKKKSTIENRMMLTTKGRYKDETRQKMVDSLILFGQKYPSKHIYNNHLITVCDTVLKREIELGNEKMIKTEKLGLMRYYKFEYMYVKEKAGYTKFGATKQYILENDQRTDDDIEHNLKVTRNMEELIEECVAKVYNDEL